jgi:hypothetical protein
VNGENNDMVNPGENNDLIHPGEIIYGTPTSIAKALL